MKATVFFDLDGTLTDPKEGITRCIQYALENVGGDVPPADELTWCIGPPLLDSLASMVGKERAPLALAAYRERFADVGWLENRVYADVHSTLAALQDTGLSMYVATSKPHVYANRILDYFDLQRFFQGVFGAELDGTRSDKSELLAFALAQSGPALICSMVGDRSHDVIGALTNDITPVGVSYGYGSRQELMEAGATLIVDRPAELVIHFLQEPFRRPAPLKKPD